MSETPHMLEWQKLDSARFNLDRTETVGGATFQARLSPFDVPIEFRVTADASGEFVRIEFNYMDEEPTRSTTAANGVVARVGKHSGRLFAVEIPHALIEREGSHAGTIIADTVRGGANILHIHGRSNVDGNHRLAARVIEEQSSLLAGT